MIGALELVRDKGSRESFDPKAGVGAHLQARALDHGVMVRALPDDIIAVCPPLIMAEPEIDDLLDRLARALDDTAAWLSRSGDGRSA